MGPDFCRAELGCASLVQPISPALLLDPLFVALILLGVALAIASRPRASKERSSPASPANADRKPLSPGERVLGALRAVASIPAKWGLRLAWIVWATHWLFATPRFSFWALSLMESPPIDVRAALGDTPESRCAMVVLTGGALSPKQGVSRVELLQGSSMPRALGAARLYRERPVGHVIITGRADAWQYPDETAHAMADVLVAFGVPRDRILIEPLALDTRQNARFSTIIVRTLDVDKTLVVTSAVHLPRALDEFRRAGLPVIGAPVDHRYEKPEGYAPYVPSIASLVRMGQVIHEILGRLKP